MAIVNCTPQPIKVVGENGQIQNTFAKAEVPARVSMSHKVSGNIDGIDLYSVEYGAVENLPEPKDGVLYIVSGVVKSALPGRTDLLQPGQLVRDGEGNIVGCKGFIA